MTRSDTAPESPTVYQREGDVARIRLNRPDSLNAVTPELYEGIQEGLDRAEAEDARVVVLEGAGRAFCVGADMEQHGETDRSAKERREYVWQAQDACEAVQTHPRPVVAKVHGYAIGAGAELALSADFVLMAEDAEIRFPEVGIGTYIGGGVTYTLTQRVGRARAKELVLSAAALTGAEAAGEGVVTSCHPATDLDAAVDELATDLAGNAPVSMEFAKAQFGRVGEASRADMLTAEAEALLACMATEDWQEGIDAFAEDRDPEFEGR
ncbi:enoyl-CoA hydratase/isomerase family protein [Haloarcula nitratireducens]|uniref:Enoyl-CoA hydratase/isomerase family protein n=1 Tax=Haloarcula nitratireducens TaxID=2487749 RepID=A0AAW4PE19_9EURY|nr:enoyl-CoA hydratase/isomerase family protein [Halomicroarcula nitratireducens]MBX0296237.1 enoyl-CoA hydratase/isomerase family protein [Halomicroarcula nitratireducens]